MADVFISYAREDRKTVETLTALIEARGVSCWFDERLAAGERFAERTAKELDAAKSVVVVWSKHSLSSHWVADEAGVARDTGRLAPISLDGSVPPLGFRQFQTIDFSAWRGGADEAPFPELAAALGASAAGAAPAPRPRRLPLVAPRRFLVAGTLVAVASVAAFLLLKLVVVPRLDDPGRVAIFSSPADAGDAALTGLADGIADDIAAALTPAGVSVAARSETAGSDRASQRQTAKTLRADLAVEGSAERVGDELRVTTSIYAPESGVALWSQTLTEKPADARLLRLRAAASTADAVVCGLVGVKSGRRAVSAESLGLFLRSCSMTSSPGKVVEARDLLAQLVEREPRFAFGHAAFAIANAYASEEAPGTIGAQFRAAAEHSAEIARRLDPDLAEAYLALTLLEDPTDFSARERLLTEGLAKNELDSNLNTYRGDLLMEVGRLEEAVSYGTRGAALDPLSTYKAAGLAFDTFLIGDAADASRQIEKLAAAWPNDSNIAQMHLRIVFWSGRHGYALAMIEQPVFGVDTEEKRECWRASTAALKAPPGPSRLAGAALVRACRAKNNLPAIQTLMLLSALGDIDGALAHARKVFVEEKRDGFAALFYPQTAAMRADPRFMKLADEIGLLAYWRESGHWPDFCQSAPYDCKTPGE